MGGRRGLYEERYFALASEQSHSPAIAEFVLDCCERFGRCPPVDGVELACGLALDAHVLARRGVRMLAVDISTAMVAEARARTADEPVRVLRRDMVRFVAPRPVDFVMSLGLNCSHIASGDAMLAHLEAVASSLRRGGLYVFDVEHVIHRLVRGVVGKKGRWLVLETDPAYFATGLHRGRRFEIQFGDTTTELDPTTYQFRSRNLVRVETAGGIRVRAFPSSGKLYTPEEIRHLVARTRRFELVARLATYDLSKPLDAHPETDRFVVVLRRR